MEARGYFGAPGYQMPVEINPAEYLLDLINTDSVRSGDDSRARMEYIHRALRDTVVLDLYEQRLREVWGEGECDKLDP